MTRRPLLLLAALAVAGCHEPDYDAWDHLLEQTRPDGTVSVDTARAAFVLTVGPLPGVPDPPGKRRLLPDGTLAFDLVLAHWDELTPEQQEAVVRYAPPPVPEAPPPTGGGSAVDANCENATDPGLVGYYQMLIAEAEKKINPLTGISIPLIYLCLHNEPPPPGTKHRDQVLAITHAFDDEGNLVGPNKPTYCQMNVYPLLSGITDDIIEETIPHEVFHCFMSRMFSSLDEHKDSPGWLREGSAEWVGDTLYGKGSPSSAVAWKTYLTRPDKSLYTLHYVAMGYYAQLEYAGLSPWPRFQPMVTAWGDGGNDAAFFAGAHDESFFAGWATSFVRQPAFGAQWDITGPGITADRVAIPESRIGNGDFDGGTIAPVANAHARLDLGADVVLIRTPAHSALHGEDNGFATDAPLGDWCALASGCTCPDGSPRQGEVLPMLPPGKAYLAVAGGLRGAGWQVVGQSLEDFCRSERIDPCLVGSWQTLTSSAAATLANAQCTFPASWGPVFTIARDGGTTTDYDASAPVTCAAGGDTLVLQFSGQATGTWDFADHGYAKGSGDISAVTVHETLDGIDAGSHPLSSLFPPGALSASDVATYTCSDHALTITNASGNTITYRR